jgi:hypothetical protein
MELFENWQETKDTLLEGVPAAKVGYTSTLLDNQYKMLQETAAAGTTASTAIANFQKIAIPMIRRIIPNNIGTELVAVQPLTGPVGLVYSQRFVYGQSVTGTPPVGQLDQGFSIAAGDEIFANNSKTRRFYSTSDASAPAGGPAAATSTGQGALTSDYESFGGRLLTTELVKQTVTARSRKLQARWTPESAQDMKASQGIDLQTSLTAATGAQVISEVDNEIINDLIVLAGTTESFDMAGTFTGVPNYIGDRHAVLGVLINKVANEIGRKTRRGSANWVVVSPLVASVLQSASKAVFAPAVAGSFEGPNNTKLIGVLNGSIKVYTYVYHDTGTEPVLLGFKGGDGELDAGYFFCPWIPLEAVAGGPVTDPNTWTQNLSLMMRYGKATFVDTQTSLGNSADFYGRISVANLSFV